MSTRQDKRPSWTKLILVLASLLFDAISEASYARVFRYTIYMYANIGPRLNQKIALAVAEVTPER